MLIYELRDYLNMTEGDKEVCVALCSIETGDIVDLTYDVDVDICATGDLLVNIQSESEDIWPMGNNITIPLSLLERVIELLDGLDAERYDYNFYSEYNDVMYELHRKMKKIDLRKAYARIIAAQDDDDRDMARIEYLRQKRLLEETEEDVFPWPASLYQEFL